MTDWIPTIGERVRTREAIDRFPHFTIDKDEQGVVDEINEDAIWIRMDRDLGTPCAEWDNCLVISTDDAWHVADDDDDHNMLLTIGVRHYLAPTS